MGFSKGVEGLAPGRLAGQAGQTFLHGNEGPVEIPKFRIAAVRAEVTVARFEERSQTLEKTVRERKRPQTAEIKIAGKSHLDQALEGGLGLVWHR